MAVEIGVQDFLRVVLEILVAEDAVREEELPIESGRVRYLLADAPIHGDETPFSRPAEVSGYYLETAHAFQVAAEHATRMLTLFGATEVSIVDSRTQLAVRLDDGTVLAGRNAREFVTEVMDVLGERLFLDEETLSLPFQPAGRGRYFLCENPVHPPKSDGSPRKMKTPLPVNAGTRQFYAEINLNRDDTLKWVLALMEHVKCPVAAWGAAAIAADGNAGDDDEDDDLDDDNGHLDS